MGTNSFAGSIRGAVFKPFNLIVIVAMVIALAVIGIGQASAHTPDVGATCALGVYANGTGYEAKDTNTLAVTVDGVSKTKQFKKSGSLSVAIPQDGLPHTWAASVTTTNPDPAYSKSDSGTITCGDRAKPDQPKPIVVTTPEEQKTCTAGVEDRNKVETTNWVFDNDSWTWVKADAVTTYTDWVKVRDLTSAEKTELGCTKPDQPKPIVVTTPQEQKTCDSGVEDRNKIDTTNWTFDTDSWTWVKTDVVTTYTNWVHVRPLTPTEKVELGCAVEVPSSVTLTQICVEDDSPVVNIYVVAKLFSSDYVKAVAYAHQGDGTPVAPPVSFTNISVGDVLTFQVPDSAGYVRVFIGTEEGGFLEKDITIDRSKCETPPVLIKVVPVIPTVTQGVCNVDTGVSTLMAVGIVDHNPNGLTYAVSKTVRKNGVDTATATAALNKNYSFGVLPKGWVLQANGTATFLATMKVPACVKTPPVVAPPTSKVVVAPPTSKVVVAPPTSKVVVAPPAVQKKAAANPTPQPTHNGGPGDRMSGTSGQIMSTVGLIVLAFLALAGGLMVFTTTKRRSARRH